MPLIGTNMSKYAFLARFKPSVKEDQSDHLALINPPAMYVKSVDAGCW